MKITKNEKIFKQIRVGIPHLYKNIMEQNIYQNFSVHPDSFNKRIVYQKYYDQLVIM